MGRCEKLIVWCGQLWLVGMTLGACTPSSSPPVEPKGLAAQAAGWNLVLVTADTLRADRLGVYGYDARPTSPRIDALHRAGVRFTRSMAPRALTWPSLASVLSGLYPSGHGLVSNGYSFPDELPTLPKLLQAEGYQTGAFLSNMCRANHQGWEVFFCGGGVDGKVRQRALEWMAGLEPERPFFLWVHYFGPHPPYYNGGEMAREVLDPGYEGALSPRKNSLDRVMKERIELTAEDRFHLDALYDAAVMGTDHLVGSLLDSLEESGKLAKTLVVFLSDHGEELYEHNGYLYHACSVYQTTLHVPLAFVAPGLLPAQAEVLQTVELIDVLPTLLELLAVAPPPVIHGSSLVPYLERPNRGGRGKTAFSEYDQTRIRTALAGEWKLIHNPDRITPFCMPGGPADLYPIAELELYDLAEDPGETRNLAPSHPQKVRQLVDLIERRFSSLSPTMHRQEIPQDLKEELETLGYVAE